MILYRLQKILRARGRKPTSGKRSTHGMQHGTQHLPVYIENAPANQSFHSILPPFKFIIQALGEKSIRLAHRFPLNGNRILIHSGNRRRFACRSTLPHIALTSGRKLLPVLGSTAFTPLQSPRSSLPVAGQFFKTCLSRPPAQNSHHKVTFAIAVALRSQYLTHPATQLVSQVRLADFFCADDTKFGGIHRRILQNT